MRELLMCLLTLLSLSSFARTVKPFEVFIKNQVSHYSEVISEIDTNEILRVKTDIPKSLAQALQSISLTVIGEKLMRLAIKENKMLSFIEVSVKTDPDMVVAFRVGFDDLGSNAIHYTTNVMLWKLKTLEGKPEKAGEEISSATLGSLLAHEMGHTEIGLASLGIIESLDNYDRIIDELRAIKRFENPYRILLKLPLRTTYFTPGDAK